MVVEFPNNPEWKSLLQRNSGQFFLLNWQIKMALFYYYLIRESSLFWVQLTFCLGVSQPAGFNTEIYRTLLPFACFQLVIFACHSFLPFFFSLVYSGLWGLPPWTCWNTQSGSRKLSCSLSSMHCHGLPQRCNVRNDFEQLLGPLSTCHLRGAVMASISTKCPQSCVKQHSWCWLEENDVRVQILHLTKLF